MQCPVLYEYPLGQGSEALKHLLILFIGIEAFLYKIDGIEFFAYHHTFLVEEDTEILSDLPDHVVCYTDHNEYKCIFFHIPAVFVEIAAVDLMCRKRDFITAAYIAENIDVHFRVVFLFACYAVVQADVDC